MCKLLPDSVVMLFRVYTIGVDIRQGRGNYSHTNYVVLSPRFLMDNQSSSVVQIAQRFATKEQVRREVNLHHDHMVRVPEPLFAGRKGSLLMA